SAMLAVFAMLPLLSAITCHPTTDVSPPPGCSGGGSYRHPPSKSWAASMKLSDACAYGKSALSCVIAYASQNAIEASPCEYMRPCCSCQLTPWPNRVFIG